jgi:hypothetical protein
MFTTRSSLRTSSVQWLIESRPPSLTWLRPAPQQRNQPPLDLAGPQPDHAETTTPNGRGVRVSTVRARWAARPRPDLPSVEEWSSTLALGIVQALLGQRSVAQLTGCKSDLATSKLDLAVALPPRSQRSAGTAP